MVLSRLFGRKKQPEEWDPHPGIAPSLPVVPYRVLYSDLPFYSDPDCLQEVRGARLLILQALDPEDKLSEWDVVPARKKYEPGQLVTWRLNNKKLWEAAWYRHPETGAVTKAWPLHVEFVGELIQLRTPEEKERVAELERKMGRASTATAR